MNTKLIIFFGCLFIIVNGLPFKKEASTTPKPHVTMNPITRVNVTIFSGERGATFSPFNAEISSTQVNNSTRPHHHHSNDGTHQHLNEIHPVNGTKPHHHVKDGPHHLNGTQPANGTHPHHPHRDGTHPANDGPHHGNVSPKNAEISSRQVNITHPEHLSKVNSTDPHSNGTQHNLNETSAVNGTHHHHGNGTHQHNVNETHPVNGTHNHHHHGNETHHHLNGTSPVNGTYHQHLNETHSLNGTHHHHHHHGNGTHHHFNGTHPVNGTHPHHLNNGTHSGNGTHHHHHHHHNPTVAYNKEIISVLTNSTNGTAKIVPVKINDSALLLSNFNFGKITRNPSQDQKHDNIVRILGSFKLNGNDTKQIEALFANKTNGPVVIVPIVKHSFIGMKNFNFANFVQNRNVSRHDGLKKE